MTYMTTQHLIGAQNKADRLDPFCGPPFQDNFDENLFDGTVGVGFGEAQWGFGGSDTSSCPNSLSDPESFLFSCAPTSFPAPGFLLETTVPSSTSNSLDCPDLLSQNWDGATGIGSGAIEQQAYGRGYRSTPLLSHSPSPPAHTSSASDTLFPPISSAELLRIEGITLHTPKWPSTQSTPASPTLGKQPSRSFEALPSTMMASSNSQQSNQFMVESDGMGVLNSQFTVPKDSSHAPGLLSPRTFPSLKSSRRTVTGSPCVRGTVENAFYNPNTAPMPPPRGQKNPVIPSHEGRYRSNWAGQMDASSALTDNSPSPPGSLLADIGDSLPWTASGLSPPLLSVEGPDDFWDIHTENQSLVGTTTAVQNATMSLAQFTDGSDFVGYEDYKQNSTPNSLPSGIMISQSRLGETAASMQDLPFSLSTPRRSISLPSSPRRLPPRTPSSGTQHTTPMSTPRRRIHGIRASTSPSPGRGRLRSVSSAAADRSLRKRRSSSRREQSLAVALGGAGFVNFTPQDGETLMTGVAPSGSTKTKVKREREEQERRRKLEQAAMKAVEAAGGNVTLLAAEARNLLGGRDD
ncbi:uncharacterized protein DNG_00794 [Cephalotrichum gorgonifer]|uniref:Developmental regulatory protein wetA n=1 Tax=Cephalotrichum gorgonifer TaxID=2041049 RepID=A0AAE8MPX1_9PEZI|nr:uncharacterized protein DNG_00794 [Cephalotrichum gorgonifer]